MGFIEWIETTRKRFIKEEFALLIAVLLIAAIFFSRPDVVGYASTSVHINALDLTIDQSQDYYLKSIDGLVHLTSVSMSGEVIGTGTVAIYLDNEQGLRMLVFKNTKKADTRINSITGYAGIGEGRHAPASGIQITGSTVPPKDGGPVLNLVKGNAIPGFDSLPAGHITVSGIFSQACVESCILQTNAFIRDRFKLEFLVEPGTVLKVTDITYTTLEEI